jgi:hypothetical protein
MTYAKTNLMRVAGRALVSAAAVALLAGAVGATTITTGSFVTWKSSSYLSAAPSELNFMPINSWSYNTSSGIVLLPSSASTPTFTFTGVDNGTYWLGADIYSKTLSGSSDSGAYVNIAFGAPQNAFLLGFGNNSGLTYTMTLSDGEVFSTTGKLFGLSLSHGINSVSIAATGPGAQAVINDFWFGTSSLTQDQGGSGPTPTPEPATMLLIAAGGLLLVGAKRRRPAKD